MIKKKGCRIGSVGLYAALSLLFVICMLSVSGCKEKGGGDEDTDTGIRKTLPKEGDEAGSFSLSLLGGGEFSLDEVKGSPVVVNFWASWCRPCRKEAPALQSAYTRYKDRGVMFVGISIQDTEAKAKAYITEFGITFPNGIDTTGDITERYKIYGIPKTFIIDKGGRFVYVHMGEITEEDLVREIEKVVI